jgi:hypothetical protein
MELIKLVYWVRCKTPFTRKSERTDELLGLIHTDVCGPITIM